MTRTSSSIQEHTNQREDETNHEYYSNYITYYFRYDNLKSQGYNMNTARTMPRMIHRPQRKVIARAKTSTPIKASSLAELRYSQAQQERIKAIKAEM